MKRPVYTPTQASEALRGLEENAAMLRTSIAQREKRRYRTEEEKAGCAAVLANERRSLAEIEAEINFLKSPATVTE